MDTIATDTMTTPGTLLVVAAPEDNPLLRLLGFCRLEVCARCGAVFSPPWEDPDCPLCAPCVEQERDDAQHLCDLHALRYS